MKQPKSFFLIFLFSFFSMNAQITKNNWLVGGSGNFSYYESTQRSEYGESSHSGYIAALRPNVGYFIVDKFAVGAKVDLLFANPEGRRNSEFGYDIGPFIRYYILETDNWLIS